MVFKKMIPAGVSSPHRDDRNNFGYLLEQRDGVE
jgi:hypothetical protein